MNKLCACLSLVGWGLFLCVGCGSNDKVIVNGADPFPPSTSPEQVFENLDVAMNQKNIELFEDLLDDEYEFFSPSQFDTLDYVWDKTEDGILTGRVFDYFDKIEYELMETGAHWIEYGSNVASEDATDISDAHPDENWEVFLRPVMMVLLDETETEGWFIETNFEFKMRTLKDPDTGEPILDQETGEPVWKIVRWGEFSSSAKIAQTGIDLASWGAVKGFFF